MSYSYSSNKSIYLLNPKHNHNPLKKMEAQISLKKTKPKRNPAFNFQTLLPTRLVVVLLAVPVTDIDEL